jgi:hypothetical protein
MNAAPPVRQRDPHCVEPIRAVGGDQRLDRGVGGYASQRSTGLERERLFERGRLSRARAHERDAIDAKLRTLGNHHGQRRHVALENRRTDGDAGIEKPLIAVHRRDGPHEGRRVDPRSGAQARVGRHFLEPGGADVLLSAEDEAPVRKQRAGLDTHHKMLIVRALTPIDRRGDGCTQVAVADQIGPRRISGLIEQKPIEDRLPPEAFQLVRVLVGGMPVMSMRWGPRDRPRGDRRS